MRARGAVREAFDCRGIPRETCRSLVGEIRPPSAPGGREPGSCIPKSEDDMKKVQKSLTLSRETVRKLNAPKSSKDSSNAGRYPTTTVLTRHISCTCI